MAGSSPISVFALRATLLRFSRQRSYVNLDGLRSAPKLCRFPIYIVACIVILLTAFASDRVKHRYTFIVSGVSIASIGYAILLAQQHVHVQVRYFALYLIMGGGYMGQPLSIIWLLNNTNGHWQRSVSAAMQIGLGNSAGIIASNIFIDKERPLYRTGYGVSLGLLWMSAAAATVTVLGCWWENKLGKGREGFVKRTY